MKRDVNDLLAVDRLARSMGAGGLNPRLREALEAEARFPSRSAGPGHRENCGLVHPSEKIILLEDVRATKNTAKKDAS